MPKHICHVSLFQATKIPVNHFFQRWRWIGSVSLGKKICQRMLQKSLIQGSYNGVLKSKKKLPRLALSLPLKFCKWWENSLRRQNFVDLKQRNSNWPRYLCKHLPCADDKCQGWVAKMMIIITYLTELLINSNNLL